jgi:hypothetical protein
VARSGYTSLDIRALPICDHPLAIPPCFRATVNGRAELPGRVVAELSFGFWWSLLADHYDHLLWAPCLRHAFINVRRRRLHAELDTVIKFRNRIAHHEPVYDRNLNDDWRRLLDIGARLSPRFAAWIDDSSRVPQTLVERPKRHDAGGPATVHCGRSVNECH